MTIIANEKASGRAPLAADSPYLNGELCWGDDFTADEIAAWVSDEELGYFGLTAPDAKSADEPDYGYTRFNAFHAVNQLRQRAFGTCVALGCARGDDVAPLGPVVETFVAIEPARTWWRDQIGGRPAVYMAPSPAGDISLEDGVADLVTSFGTLHHIPNVSHLLDEASRILSPGGLLVLREPISSMGPWWRPRTGLTSRERGLPSVWLRKRLEERGFSVIRWRYCHFGPLSKLIRLTKLPISLNGSVYIYLDWFLSELFSWNNRYHRTNAFMKFAPGSVFVIAEKKPGLR